jgi:glutathione-independent formaldehyde dehydrogenase
VLISGAGPVGLAAAASAFLLGAAVVMVADFSKERLAQARSFGCETIDLTKGGTVADQVEQVLGVREVDCAVDCVGFEAKGQGGAEQPAIVLNQLMDVTRAAGAIGIPGLYVTEDPGSKDAAARQGSLSLRFGLGWAKSHSFSTGQTPVLKYNRGLMMAVLHDRIQIAKAVNATVITLDQAPQGYADFDRGAARKYVIDPHGLLGKPA